MKDKILNFLLLLCGLTIIFLVLPIDGVKKDLKNNFEKIKTARKEIVKPVTHKFISNINKVELSYKPKEEILNLRKNYVNNSIFASKNYKPSEEIFGQIIDGKPWIANNYCLENNYGKVPIDGESKCGLAIANPELLVIIEFPYMFSFKDEAEKNYCKHFSHMMQPKYVIYDKGRNEIEIAYEPLEKINNFFYQFNGINARDFGYKYVYLDKDKSSVDLIFYSNKNVSNEVVKFHDYYHLGSSCKHKSGCNNISPFQGKLQFIPNSGKKYHNGKIYLKLWKNKPNSPYNKADINVIFNFNI